MTARSSPSRCRASRWEWFGLLLETPALHEATRNSLIIAVSVSLLATCLGLFAARAATRYRFPAKAGIMGFIMLPLVLPEVIVAISLLVVLMQLGLESGGWSIILGHALLCIPFSIAILQGSFSNMDQSLEEAAVDLGETPLLDLPADHPAAGRARDHRLAPDLFHHLAR
jgi:spermidine/putrescine transport system permease protein